MTRRIALHDYRTNPALSQRDGVNLAYTEIARLLRRVDPDRLKIRFHDFVRLLADPAYARHELSGVDTVISNVGPHAHYYFYLREKLGLDFRIVRDSREAMRSNYMLQEHLAQPLWRDDDVVLFVSHYGRTVFSGFFPRLADTKTVVCYPFVGSFPERARVGPDVRERPGCRVTLGYVGRLSEDKNVPQLIDILIRLEQASPGRYRLAVLGDLHSPSCAPGLLAERIRQATGRSDLFDHRPPVQHSKVWDFYAEIDALLFLSTSNIETLGRVLVEGSYVGLPTIASRHAAASELLSPEALAWVEYDTQTTWSTHYDFPLGRVRVEDVVTALDTDIPVSDCWRRYATHAEDFLQVIAGETVAKGAAPCGGPTPSEVRFVNGVRLAQMPQSPTAAESLDVLGEMTSWFVDLHLGDQGIIRRRLAQLRGITGNPDRTARYVARIEAGQGDFTNVGGIDFEMCHVARFYPTFTLTPDVNAGES